MNSPSDLRVTGDLFDNGHPNHGAGKTSIRSLLNLLRPIDGRPSIF